MWGPPPVDRGGGDADVNIRFPFSFPLGRGPSFHLSGLLVFQDFLLEVVSPYPQGGSGGEPLLLPLFGNNGGPRLPEALKTHRKLDFPVTLETLWDGQGGWMGPLPKKSLQGSFLFLIPNLSLGESVLRSFKDPRIGPLDVFSF